MNKRSHATRPVKQGDVRRMVRTRNAPAPLPEGREGEVVRLRAGEDYTLNLLRACPKELSEFRPGLLHVSDVIGKCMRKIALSDKIKKAMPSESISDSLGLTFAQGVALHDYVKAKFIKGHPDKLYGRWSCLCGETVTDEMLAQDPPNTPCRNCNTVSNRYRELDIKDEELGIVGSPDVLLYIAEEAMYYPIELKSITYDDWKEMVRPKPDHVTQVLFYWYLLLRANYSVPDQVSIVYISKGYIFKSPYKEFVVKIGSLEEVEERLGIWLEDAAALKTFRDGGELPPRNNCPNINCKDAKECHVATVCFG